MDCERCYCELCEFYWFGVQSRFSQSKTILGLINMTRKYLTVPCIDRNASGWEIDGRFWSHTSYEKAVCSNTPVLQPPAVMGLQSSFRAGVQQGLTGSYAISSAGGSFSLSCPVH